MTFGSTVSGKDAASINNQCWGYLVGGGNEMDPELPCPDNLFDYYIFNNFKI